MATSNPQPPAPPQPESDCGIIPSVKSPPPEEDDLSPENVNIFTLTPVAALKLLCGSIDTLVRLTGDIPPTPPVRSRGHSPAPGPSSLRHSSVSGPETPRKENMTLQLPGSRTQAEHIDGVPFVKTPIGSPEAHPHEPMASLDVGANTQPIHLQHGAIARKFYSKKPPPISTQDYLLRMHKYCAMSTAVYLATSTYITRMVIAERLLPVTPRNVHRLLLAGLRVAMKALEDLSWPHARFSKVGGVSEIELGRLEITFCFLMDFNLKVDEGMLQREAVSLCRQNLTGPNKTSLESPVSIDLKLPPDFGKARGGEKRKASSALPSRPAIHASNIEVSSRS